MKFKPTNKLDAALSASLQLRKTYARPLPFLQYTWIQESNFRAQLEFCSGSFVLEVTVGLKANVEGFWRSIKPEPRTQAADATNTALIWLILHEMSHIDLGHFKLEDNFGIAQRSSVESKPLFSLSSTLRPLAPLCLEMQADHEAADMLLGAYSTDGWTELRQRVLAISGMMMLIEREDAKSGAEGRTHPKAATRIFQLLGHVSEMPLIRAQLAQDAALIPPEEELQTFAHEVTIPCFFDAIQLAQVAEAASIESDLGTPEDFFKDLQIAKLGDPSHYDALKTQGAQQWATLWPCNEALKPILGGHFTT